VSVYRCTTTFYESIPVSDFIDRSLGMKQSDMFNNHDLRTLMTVLRSRRVSIYLSASYQNTSLARHTTPDQIFTKKDEITKYQQHWCELVSPNFR
jgi:hypothetical protein